LNYPGQFKAEHWLSSYILSSKKKTLKDIHEEIGLHNEFSPANYCVAGWSGESLMTSSALNISNLIEDLSLEAFQFLLQKNALPPSLKRSIYDEFISYTIAEEITLKGLDSPEFFWENVYNKESLYQKTLKNFLKSYALKTVTVYVFKIRFITHFCRAANKTFDKLGLQNPGSFLEKIFPKGSSYELSCEALRPNQYSWYRPAAHFQDRIFDLAKNFHLVSITQMMKMCTYSTSGNENENEDEKSRVHFKDKEFSHALSHKSFGLFLNELELVLPSWLESLPSPKNPQTNYDKNGPEIQNVKLTGNHLSALILSHWLAQEHHLKTREDDWKELICPNFIGNTFFSGSFVRYCQELQFLTFLSEMASKLKHAPVKLLASVMRQRYEINGIEAYGQCSILNQEQIFYRRIVLNLSDLPPRNPHNALLFRITSEAKSLASDGVLMVMSNQKLFVPSQEDKTRQLFDDFKLVALFNFEKLSGRGEIPSYFYIFTRREHGANYGPSLALQSRKEQCRTFRLEGELKTFSKFQTWVEYFSSFLQNSRNLHLPIHQADLGENLTFQFHQDFIIDGRIVQSDNDDPHCITHPSFIRNLAQACLPFDKFFRIENIREEQTTNLLSMSSESCNNYPLLLIVDRSNTDKVRLEITSFDTYPAKLEKFGTAYYNYFGLISKIADININLFREYFSTKIGTQVVQISLGGNASNLRSKIKGLLIPAFFALNISPSQSELAPLGLFGTKSPELLKMDSLVLTNKFETHINSWEELAQNHPWYCLGLLVGFKQNIDEALEKIEHQKNAAHFQNPVIIAELIKLKTFTIFPTNHPDLFTELCVNHPQALNVSLGHVALNKTEAGDSCLELNANNQTIVRLHAPFVMLKFAEFILEKAQGKQIGMLLNCLKLPSNNELVSVLGNYELVANTFEKMAKTCVLLIEKTISREISRAK